MPQERGREGNGVYMSPDSAQKKKEAEERKGAGKKKKKVSKSLLRLGKKGGKKNIFQGEPLGGGRTHSQNRKKTSGKTGDTRNH